MEGASGVAALVKSILALEKGYIPPQMFFRKPNPNIPFRQWNLEIPTALTPWPRTKGPRRVSINNFGVGGTNSHAIVEGAPRQQQQQQQGAPMVSAAARKKRLFVLSSQDKHGIVRVAQSLAGYLDDKEEDARASASAAHAASLAYTLGNKRSRFSWKKFCIATDSKDLRSGLRALTSDGAVRSNAAPRIGFVFTGQGTQWPLMSLKLLGELLRSLVGIPIYITPCYINGMDSKLSRTKYANDNVPKNSTSSNPVSKGARAISRNWAVLGTPLRNSESPRKQAVSSRPT